MVDQENNPPFHFCQPTKTNPSVPPGIAGNENKPVILPRLNQLANPFTPAFGQVGFGNILSQGSTATNATGSASNKPSQFPKQESATPPPRIASGPIFPNLLRFTDNFKLFRGSTLSESPTLSPGSYTDGCRIPAAEKTRGYLQLLHGRPLEFDATAENTIQANNEANIQEIKTTPLFSNHVRTSLENGMMRALGSCDNPFPQYGLLGLREETYNSRHPDASRSLPIEDNLIFANGNAPWSTFICGSQGAGKSHSLSCLLENSLLSTSPAGENPKPLAALVFHYDKFTGHESTQLCEAAYLCSAAVPVRVLVSPSNFHVMHKLYRNLPGLPKNGPKPQVLPLYLQEHQLNVSRMMTLMAMKEDARTPLYMETIYKVLRDMSIEKKGGSGLDYLDFKSRLTRQGFSGRQNGSLKLRLDLLESVLAHPVQSARSRALLDDIFKSAQGTLTIIDLSCPFVNENDACALFTICLTIFMENRADCGRVIALDEAHKFLTKSGEAEKLTEQLISIVRQQRHLATRIIVSTQEPTLAPGLLDLCNVSIVHRFNSPAWYKVLQGHLAGARLYNDHGDAELFEMIVGLQTGEALIFCPSALFDIRSGEVHRLKDAFIRAKIRSRVTTDGGKSILASDQMQIVDTEAPALEELIRPFVPPAGHSLKSRAGNGGRDQADALSLAGSNPPTTRSQKRLFQKNTAPPVNPDAAAAQQLAAYPASHSTAPPAVADALVTQPLGPAEVNRFPAPLSSEPQIAPPIAEREIISQDEAKSYLRSAVSNSLHKNHTKLSFQRVRQDAATAAGLRQDFFDVKEWRAWSRAVIHQQVDQHAANYGIPKAHPC